MARYVSGIILAILAIALLAFAEPIHLKAVVGVLALVALWEFLNLVRIQELFLKLVGSILLVAGLGLMWFSAFRPYYLMYFYLVLFFSFTLQFAGSKDSQERIRRTSFFLLALIYTTILFGILALLVDLSHFRFWLFLTLACTFAGDTGAYFAGKNFGKHKLAPSISPGKTIEGVIGGVLLAAIAAAVVRHFMWPDQNLFFVLGLGMVLAFVGMLGDLSESLLKRGFNVKDSGNIIPGHGGILDRLDGLLFNGPIVYFAAQMM